MKTILLIDDDEDDQYIVKSFVDSYSPESIRLIIKNNGQEALDFVEQEGYHPDFVLLDLNMPVLDGIGFLKRYRTKYVSEFTPVVIYTTSSSPKDIKEAYMVGANAFIVKPIDYTENISVLRRVVDFWTTVSN